MAKVNSEKKFVSFVKGLITEASPLTFPENASLCEDNFVLNIDGSRKRRLGLDYETGYALKDTAIPPITMQQTRQSFHRWDFPGGSSTVSIGVVRVHNKLWFIDVLHASPSSAAALLNNGNPITIENLANADIETISITGFLVVVSSDIKIPVLLSYNKNTKLVEQELVPIQVRDFPGVEDLLKTDERPVTLDANGAHEYNLMNQGWGTEISSICALGIKTPAKGYWERKKKVLGISRGHRWREAEPATYFYASALACTKTKLGVFPSNVDLWTYGKTAAVNADGTPSLGNFEKYSPELMERNSTNNTPAPKGAYILDAFNRGTSRRALTGLNNLLADDEEGRITTVASYAGRLFYSGVTSVILDADVRSPNYSGYVFFSQSVTGEENLGKCYQEADPTSPDISDLVDTDGGTIQFPEITRVVKLVNVRDSLIIMAENGIWEIYGDTGGFKATSFQIAKIANTGINNAKAVVVSGNTIVYWAKAGIFTLVQDPQTGRYAPQNISLVTIQSEYASISDIAKRNARGFFDEKKNQISWLYNNEATYGENNYVNNYNRMLNLDLILNAFYNFTFSSLYTNSPKVVDFIGLPGHYITLTELPVYVGGAPLLVGDAQVHVSGTEATNRAESFSLLTFREAQFTISKLSSNSFFDWKTANGVGVDFSSYLITGFDTFGDIMRNKQVPYIWFYFNRTETGVNLELTPSGCTVQAQWNWANSNAQGKWGTAFQAYRYSPTTTVDTGETVMVTKNKLRGSGRALSLYISSEAGKDMQLLGWAHLVSGDGTP